MVTMLSRVGSFSLLKRCGDRAASSIRRSARKRLREGTPTSGASFSFTEESIRSLASTIESGGFVFSPLTPMEIPKGISGKFRGLSVPRKIDRVAHRAMYRVLLPEYIPIISEHASYGVLRRRGVKVALSHLKKAFSIHGEYVLICDIQKFFNNLDRKKLAEKILSPLPDRSLDELVIQLLAPRYSRKPKHPDLFPGEIYGIAQGCSLSSVFADVYLKEFDAAMHELGYFVIRYVDDLIIVCRTHEQTHEAYFRAAEILGGLSLRLDAFGKAKCRSCHISDGPEFLGVKIDAQGRLNVEPKKAYQFKQSIGSLVRSLGPEKKRREREETLCNMINGWLGAYACCDDFHEHKLKIQGIVNKNLVQMEKDGRLDEKALSSVRLRIARLFKNR